MKIKPTVQVSPLHLAMKVSFSQASSKRIAGESVWAVAERNGIKGLGEGCPRPYVTGETVTSALDWLNEVLPSICEAAISFENFQVWISINRKSIDTNPAAFCSVETALLDLFAKEKNGSVEQLLGLKNVGGPYQYTAVLGDAGEATFSALVDRYLKIGFTDFKVKIMSDLEKDRRKLDILLEKCQAAGFARPRIRLDANNVWETADEAIHFLQQLQPVFFAVEEPVTPKDYVALSTIGQSLHTSIILDESLCNLHDLERLEGVDGKFIANIKVSRVGGVIRAIELVKALQKKGIPIIIGAHVAETSVMTRAGLSVANAAGMDLLAQEGAFGLILLENEPVHPSLMFGARGRLDLSKPYLVKTKEEQEEIPVGNWSYGWGVVESNSAGLS